MISDCLRRDSTSRALHACANASSVISKADPAARDDGGFPGWGNPSRSSGRTRSRCQRVANRLWEFQLRSGRPGGSMASNRPARGVGGPRPFPGPMATLASLPMRYAFRSRSRRRGRLASWTCCTSSFVGRLHGLGPQSTDDCCLTFMDQVRARGPFSNSPPSVLEEPRPILRWTDSRVCSQEAGSVPAGDARRFVDAQDGGTTESRGGARHPDRDPRG